MSKQIKGELMTVAQVQSPQNSRRNGRKVERIRLFPPLTGRLGSTPVVVSDLSVTGAGIEHEGALPVGCRGKLSFDWTGGTVEVPCTVQRCRLVGFSAGKDRLTVYATGLRFEADDPGENQPVREMIEACVRRALREQKANARAERGGEPRAVPDPDDTGRKKRPLLVAGSRETGYWCYRLDQGRWRKSRTQNPEQPTEGFTVSAAEDSEQLELLCGVYERCEEWMKKMIRILAQLSVAERDGEDHRRYVP
jgi:hypothetical protein